MKRPGFFEGAALGLAASLAGSASYLALGLVFPRATVGYLLVAGLGFAYTVYLLMRSPERVGRLVTLTVWMGGAALVWFLSPSLQLYLLFHLGLVWLVRSLYFQASLLSALADLALNGLALAAATAAALRTGSVFMSLWCFFLVQALFVFIPPALPRQGRAEPAQAPDAFQQAHRAAEAALRRLSSLT